VIISTKKENDFDGSDCSGHLVMLDAMASGKAIVASYRSTISDYITDGQEGILVEPKNKEALRREINKLLDDPQIAKDMGNRAREKANNLLTTEIFAKNLANIFYLLMR
jgi:glycosyltransferase involved in cell wall biosynthesis